MALNAPNLFEQNPLFSDDGRMLSENDQEGAGRNKTVIMQQGSASGAASTTIYTVPADKILFISAVGLAALTGSTTTNYLTRIYIVSTSKMLIQLVVSKATTNTINSDNGTLSFPQPIKAVAGETVVVYGSSVGGVAYGQFVGWLESA